jgi:hypothetical protein
MPDVAKAAHGRPRAPRGGSRHRAGRVGRGHLASCRRRPRARPCCQELIDAGVYVIAGGLEDQPASLVASDGTVSDGPNPDVISGVTVVDVPSRDEALRWAAKIAAACRCTQEVRQIGFDPELDVMLREAAERVTGNS